MCLILHRYVRPSAEIWCLHRGRLTGVLAACDGLHPSPCRTSGRLLGRDRSHHQPPAHGDVCRPGKQVASFLFPFTASRRPLAAGFPLENMTGRTLFAPVLSQRTPAQKKRTFQMLSASRRRNEAAGRFAQCDTHSRFFYHKTTCSRHPSLRESLFLLAVQMCLFTLSLRCVAEGAESKLEWKN